MRKLSLLLIVLGIFVALYPQANRAYYLGRQARILAQWEETAPAKEAVPPAEGRRLSQPENAAADEKAPVPAKATDPVAVLVIGKINLEIPVFRGATRANLRLGAGLLEDGAFPGAAGNAVVTAHRSHNYGMQFNRLDELEAGDEILVGTKNRQFRYVVFEKAIVKPDDISLPEGAGGARLLTLITCHPLYSRDPPYRLVVLAGME